jgi:hypothetical protein
MVPGDNFAWWRSATGSANIVVRRGNIVLHVAPLGQAQEALATTLQIDALIRDDRQIAPLGKFAEPPEIVDPGFPQTLTVRRMMPLTPDGQPWRNQPWTQAYVRISPRFRGLGSLEKLRFAVRGEHLVTNQVDGTGRSLVKTLVVPDEAGRARPMPPSAENDGRFILSVRVPQEPTTEKLTLVAATEDNLIVTKELEVKIVPAD